MRNEFFKGINKHNAKNIVIISVIVIIILLFTPIFNFFVRKTPTYESIFSEYHIKKGFSYIIKGDYQNAAKHFDYYDTITPFDSNRVKTEDEMVVRLEKLSSKGIKIISINEVKSYFDEMILLSFATITIKNDKTYKCVIQFQDNKGKPSIMGIQKVEVYSDELMWNTIESDDYPHAIKDLIYEIRTYYAG